MTPENRMVQVRVPEYKNLIDKNSQQYNRTSFHDDFIIIKPHKWDGGMHEGSPHFNQIVRESPYLIIDGELPWGTWSMNEDPDNPEAGSSTEKLQPDSCSCNTTHRSVPSITTKKKALPTNIP